MGFLADCAGRWSGLSQGAGSWRWTSGWSGKRKNGAASPWCCDVNWTFVALCGNQKVHLQWNTKRYVSWKIENWRRKKRQKFIKGCFHCLNLVSTTMIIVWFICACQNYMIFLCFWDSQVKRSPQRTFYQPAHWEDGMGPWEVHTIFSHEEPGPSYSWGSICEMGAC